MDDLQKSKDRLLTREEAAEFLGVKVVTLAVWKSTQRYDLPSIKVGRLVRYRYQDLISFLERRTIGKAEADARKGIPPRPLIYSYREK